MRILAKRADGKAMLCAALTGVKPNPFDAKPFP